MSLNLPETPNVRVALKGEEPNRTEQRPTFAVIAQEQVLRGLDPRVVDGRVHQQTPSCAQGQNAAVGHGRRHRVRNEPNLQGERTGD